MNSRSSVDSGPARSSEIAVGDSEFFFVPHSCHVDQFIFSHPNSLKFTTFIHLITVKKPLWKAFATIGPISLDQPYVCRRDMTLRLETLYLLNTRLNLLSTFVVNEAADIQFSPKT